MPIQETGTTLHQPNYDIKRASLSSTQVQEVSFFDMTLQAGLVTPHSQKSTEIKGIHESLGAGICTFDANDDGWLDILVLRGTGSTHYFGKPEWWQKSKNSVSLYINNRNGSFSDRATESGLVSSSISMGCAVGDLDADGDQDIFLANRGQNEVWENTGNTSFKQRLSYTPKSDEWSTSATIANFNNDGLADIYVANYLDFKPNSLTFEASAGFTEEKAPNFDPTLHSGVPNQLLINKGGLKFEDQAQSYGISNPQGRGLAATASDINSDGTLDLLVANGSNSENKLYLNTGNGFKDVSTKSQLSINSQTPSIQVMNLVNETDDSLLISSGGDKFSRVLTLEKNSSVFKDLSDTWKLNTLSGIHDVSWSPAIADFNMDGWQDALMVNGVTLPNGDAKQLSQTQAPYLLLNSQGKRFVKQSDHLGSSITAIESSRCAVSGDFNNDGSPDAIIASNNGLVQLLINNTRQRNWVGLILKHTKDNVLPTGAIIELTTNKRSIKRKIQDGSHGLCWQDNGRVSIPLKSNEVPVKATLVHQGNVVAKSNMLELDKYNIVTSEDEVESLESLIEYKSIIALQSDKSKIAVIDLLLSDGHFSQASSELLLLLKNNNIETQRTASTLINTLPIASQVMFAPTLLQSEDKALISNGLDLIRNTEDDRLARWLFAAIMNADDDIACNAMGILEHFFAEEEAMILSKYAGLDHLIQNALSDNEARQRCAIQALGESERYKVIEPLIELLNSTNTNVRQDAIVALGRVRERDALPALLSKFKKNNETAQNRLLLMQSIKAIDPSFDGIGTMLSGLQSNSRAAYLETIALAFSPRSNAVPINNKTDITKRLRNWYIDTRPKISASEEINYLKVTSNQESVPLDELTALSNNDDALVQVNALLLLMRVDSKRAENYLNKILTIGQLSLFESTPNLNLSEKLLFNALESANENDQIKTINALFPHLSEKAKQQFTVQLLIKKETDSKRILLNEVLQKYVPQLTPELCDSFRYLLSDNKQYTESILQLTNLLGANAIETCYDTKEYRNQQEALANNLLTNSKLKTLAIRFFAAKPQRWARNLTMQRLTAPSTPQQELIQTISSLGDKPFPSQLKTLNKLFSNEGDSAISMAAAQKLAGNPAWIEKNLDIIQARIRRSIANNQEQTAIELGRILFNSYRKDTLDIFLATSTDKTSK